MPFFDEFRGGTPGARNRLNGMIDELNPLANLRGDSFIGIERSGGSVNLRLMIDKLRERFPSLHAAGQDTGVVVRIDSLAAGGGKYDGTILEGTSNASAGGILTMPEGMSIPSGGQCLVLNLAEDGSTDHALNVGDYLIGFEVGTSSDSSALRVVAVCQAAGGSSEGLVVRVDSLAEGGGKYYGRVLDGTADPSPFSDLGMPEGMGEPSANDCLIINLAEDGSPDHALSPGDFLNGHRIGMSLLDSGASTGETSLPVISVDRATGSSSGSIHLGIVKSPGANGTASGSFNVDIYGATVASVDISSSGSPTFANQAAIASGGGRFYWGELVGVQKVAGVWNLIKFLTLPISYSVTAGQVALRLWPQNESSTTPTTTDLSSLVIDLETVISAGMFGTLGSDTTKKLILFDWGSFSGIGSTSTNLSVPVIDNGYTKVSYRSFYSTLAALEAAEIPNISSVTNGQDTFSSLTRGSLTWSQTLTPSGYITQDTTGFSEQYFELPVRVNLVFGNMTDATLFPSCPAAPSIYKQVAGDFKVMLLYAHAVIQGFPANAFGAPPTKVYPNINGDKTVGHTLSAAGNYTLNLNTGVGVAHPDAVSLLTVT